MKIKSVFEYALMLLYQLLPKEFTETPAEIACNMPESSRASDTMNNNTKNSILKCNTLILTMLLKCNFVGQCYCY